MIILEKYNNLFYVINFKLELPCEIYCKNFLDIPITLDKILSDILNKFKDNIVYIDTYEVFFVNFNDIKEKFEIYFNKINIYDLSYSSMTSKFALFIGINQYIIEENNSIVSKGIKYFNN
jgi:hypothetical protein